MILLKIDKKMLIMLNIYCTFADMIKLLNVKYKFILQRAFQSQFYNILQCYSSKYVFTNNYNILHSINSLLIYVTEPKLLDTSMTLKNNYQ